MTAVNEAKPRRSRELLHGSQTWILRPSHAPRLGYHDRGGGVGVGPRWRRFPPPTAAWTWGRGHACHVIAPAGRAPPAASSARRQFGDLADGASSFLGAYSRVFAKSGGSLPAVEGRSGARKGGTGPCRGKGSVERGPCSPRRGRRSEPPARGRAGEALAGVLGDCRALTARLLGRFGAFHLGHGRRGDPQVPSGLRAFDLGVFRVSHRHVASKPAGLRKGCSPMFSCL